jgi:glycerol uptake facilitator protein
MDRQKIAHAVTEFIGTYILASVVLAFVVRTQFPFFAAAAAGVALASMTLVFGRTVLPVLNPAITIGLWTVRKIETTTAIVYVAAQMLAGFVAYRFNSHLIDANLRNIAGQNLDWRIVAVEAIGSFVLALGVSVVVFEKMDRIKASAVLGLSLMVGVIIASLAGNHTINPAVALGIHSWSTAYVVGPVIGAVLGTTLYAFLYAPREAILKKKR